MNTGEATAEILWTCPRRIVLINLAVVGVSREGVPFPLEVIAIGGVSGDGDGVSVRRVLPAIPKIHWERSNILQQIHSVHKVPMWQGGGQR